MNGKLEQKLARRHVLRGAGSVAIALPFLLSQEGSVKAQIAAPKERLITLFYGNGMPVDVAAKPFEYPLDPLAPFRDRMAFVRGIDVRLDRKGTNGHPTGSTAFASGIGYRDNDNKGGPSLDWVAAEVHGQDLARKALATGVFDNQAEGDHVRHKHSWRGAGEPNDPIVKTLDLFHDLFGGQELMPMPDASQGLAALRARYRVSVLDKVVEESNAIAANGAAYPASARRQIDSHLQTIRELEQVVLQQTMDTMPSVGCEKPAPPPDLNAIPVNTTNQKDNPGLKTPEWEKVWDILLDLYVTGMRCDLVRFGNLVMTAGGDRFGFDAGAKGMTNNAHLQAFHGYDANNKSSRDIVHAVLYWEMDMVARFLKRLADPAFLDVDGGTLLDNTTLIIGTELGNPQSHSLDDLTFFITGGRGRFKTGVIDAQNRTDVDLYNTILRGIGVPTGFGDQSLFQAADLPILA